MQSLGVAIVFFGLLHTFLTVAEIAFLKFLPWLDDKLPLMGFMADWSLNNALIFLGVATLGVVAISVVVDNFEKNHIITDKIN